MYGDKKFQCVDGTCGAGDCYNCNPQNFKKVECDGCDESYYAWELDQSNLCPECLYELASHGKLQKHQKAVFRNLTK